MISRIQLILKTKNISPSQFADQIQVQRSGVSHILSGRNNPSLDFILKILRTYPEIDADWLLFGKGQMVNLTGKPDLAATATEEIKVKAPVQPDLFAQTLPPQVEPKTKVKEEKAEPVAITLPEKVTGTLKEEKADKIEKIVIFYESNSFKEYKPK